MRAFQARPRTQHSPAGAAVRRVGPIAPHSRRLNDAHATLDGVSFGLGAAHGLATHPDRRMLEREADHAADAVLAASGPESARERCLPGGASNPVHAVGPTLSREQRAYFEPRFGFDFSAVRVHADAAAHAWTERLGARAFTAGSHIVLGANASLRTLAHELAHVAQQGFATPLIARRHPPLVRPNAAAPAVQFDLAVQPPRPNAVAALLTQAQIDTAIRFNQARMADPQVFAIIRDVMGAPRLPAVVDAQFVQIIANWQAQFGLPVNGQLNEPTVTTVVTELRAESVRVPTLAADADRVELEAARTFNEAQGLSQATIGILQGLLHTPHTGTWNSATIRALMARQQAEHLPSDGMLTPATLRPLILELVGSSAFNDAIQLIVDAHHFPTANLASIQFDATVTGADAITTGTIGAGSPQTVRVGPSTFSAPYEHMIRIIGHELQHVQQRSAPAPIANQHVREFLSFAWEALATESPALTPADRVGHANIAIHHWNAAPVADRTPHQSVRDRLDLLIAAGGVGNF